MLMSLGNWNEIFVILFSDLSKHCSKSKNFAIVSNGKFRQTPRSSIYKLDYYLLIERCQSLFTAPLFSQVISMILK